jgi:two-component system NtrC family sensor kinase
MATDFTLPHNVETLYAITEEISASVNEHQVLEALLRRIVTDLGYKAATLRLLDEEKQQLELKAAYGLSEQYLAKGAIDVAKSGIDQTVLAGQRVYVADASKAPGFQYPEQAAREGLASMLALPLSTRQRIIGVLHVYTATVHEFTPEESMFLAAIANLGAQTMYRTHLFEAFQHIAHQVNSTLELDKVLTTLLVELVRELNVKAGSLRLLGPRRLTLHLAAAYGLSKTYLDKGTVTLAESPIDRLVLETNEPKAITELTAESGFQYPAEAEREGIRSVLVLPLRAHATSIGVLRLYSAQVRTFGVEDLNFARAVADLGALAIENAKLHQYVEKRMQELKENADGWYRFLAFS